MKTFLQFFLEATQIPDDTPYEVVDRHTGEIVWSGTYSKRNIARRVVDRRDNAYGGYRFQARISPKAMDDLRSKDVIKEYRHNLADGTPTPSIQVHNGKNPNNLNKKKLHTVGPYQNVNKKLTINGSVLTAPEMEKLKLNWENGKTINNYKNSGASIQMFVGAGGQPLGRVIIVK